MKKLVIISIFGFFVCSMFAQHKINVQNGARTEFFDDLETAIGQAVSGDTIYLPGRAFQVQSDIVIDKQLVIIGAGWDVDSIGGLQTTEIKIGSDYATINFRNGSDGSLLMGCIVGTIQFGHRDDFDVYQQDIRNVTIWRNMITGAIVASSWTNNQIRQIRISENLITGRDGSFSVRVFGAYDCIINNNHLFTFYICRVDRNCFKA